MNMRPLYQPRVMQTCKPKPSPDQRCERFWKLPTHSAGALYQAFPASESQPVLRRMEFHYVPKHASWFNMIEIEIRMLRGQCLDSRIATQERLVSEIGAWERQRNAFGSASNGCSS